MRKVFLQFLKRPGLKLQFRVSRGVFKEFSLLNSRQLFQAPSNFRRARGWVITRFTEIVPRAGINFYICLQFLFAPRGRDGVAYAALGLLIRREDLLWRLAREHAGYAVIEDTACLEATISTGTEIAGGAFE